MLSIDPCLTVHRVGQSVLSDGLGVWLLLMVISFLNVLKIVDHLGENFINCTNSYI